jgi:hypothetical protein
MRGLGLLVAVLTVAGCGGSVSLSRAPAQANSEWVANMTVVIPQLRNDVAETQVIAATPRAGRAALKDESTLYALLIAYSDLAGCRHIVASAGSAPPHAATIGASLGSACVHLERAAALFTRAATNRDGRPLAAATREARRALPALVRAAAALARLSGRR